MTGRFDSPFDLPLESRFVDLSLYGVAVDAFMAECVARSGLEYTVGTWDLSRPAVRAFSSLGYPNLDPELVETYGYRAPRDSRELAPPAALSSAIPAGEEERFTQVQQACTEESRGAVPDVAASGNILLQLDTKSREAAVGDLRVVASVERWRACVTHEEPRLGDLSGSPEDFRVSVLSAVDARDNPGVGDTMTLSAPPDEIEAAMIDIACRARSGYDNAYFSAIGEAQERLMSEYRVALEGVQKDMDEIQQAIDHYVLDGEG
ncbi:MAG: hypothetical protein HGA44_17295 [Cellulomonadaceae bacterium]|nr:hypothetical protein [Cellulomonadaceae bacterium]